MSGELVHLVCVGTGGFVVDSGGAWTASVLPMRTRADAPPLQPRRFR